MCFQERHAGVRGFGALPSRLLIAECLHAIRNPPAERRFHCLGQCENTKVAWRRGEEADGGGRATVFYLTLAKESFTLWPPGLCTFSAACVCQSCQGLSDRFQVSRKRFTLPENGQKV